MGRAVWLGLWVALCMVASAASKATVAPALANYTVEYSQDTFDICKELSGLERDVSLEELLEIFRLPADLPHRKHVNLVQFMQMMQEVQPDVQVVFAPMLFGEADFSGVLSAGLPKLIHFTVKDKNRLKPHQVVSMASWARFNPGHSILLFDDHDVRLFMNTYFQRLLPTFDSLGSQVERTDMWRYLVLCVFGGVYADSDVVAARPTQDWVQDAGLLVGIENVFTTWEAARKRTYARQVQMVQWVIAAKRGHPVVCRMGDYVRDHVNKEASGEFYDPDRNHAILERTGPGIWSSSVYDYITEHGLNVTDVVAGMKVGDMRVLPQPVFGCPSSNFNPWYDPVPYVYHMFKGSWRKAPPSKLALLMETLWHLALDAAWSLQHQPATDPAAAGASAAVATGANSRAAASSSSSSTGQAAQEPRKLRANSRVAAVAATGAVAAPRRYPPMQAWFPGLVLGLASGVLLAVAAGVARSGCVCYIAGVVASQPAVAAALARGQHDGTIAWHYARSRALPLLTWGAQATGTALRRWLRGAVAAAVAAANRHELTAPLIGSGLGLCSSVERPRSVSGGSYSMARAAPGAAGALGHGTAAAAAAQHSHFSSGQSHHKRAVSSASIGSL